MPRTDDSPPTRHKSSLGYVLCFTATFFWSTAATAFKFALQGGRSPDAETVGFSPAQFLFWATLTSAVLLALINAFRFRGKVFRGINRRSLPIALVAGILNPITYYLVLLKAYELLPAQEAQPLNYTWAIALTILSILVLRQRPRIWIFPGMLISFLGILVISTRGDLTGFRFTHPLGDSLALGSGLVWASYWIINMKRKGDPVQNLMISFMFALPIATVIAALNGGIRAMPTISLISSIYCGVFEMGLTFTIWLSGIKLVPDISRVSNIPYLAPFLSLVWIRFILGERLMFTSIIGLILIVSGIIIQNISRDDNR